MNLTLGLNRSQMIKAQRMLRFAPFFLAKLFFLITFFSHVKIFLM